MVSGLWSPRPSPLSRWRGGHRIPWTTGSTSRIVKYSWHVTHDEMVISEVIFSGDWQLETVQCSNETKTFHHVLHAYPVGTKFTLFLRGVRQGSRFHFEVPLKRHYYWEIACSYLQSVSEVVGTAFPVPYFNVGSNNESVSFFNFSTTLKDEKDRNHHLHTLQHTVFQGFVRNCSLSRYESKLETVQCNINW